MTSPVCLLRTERRGWYGKPTGIGAAAAAVDVGTDATAPTLVVAAAAAAGVSIVPAAVTTARRRRRRCSRAAGRSSGTEVRRRKTRGRRSPSHRSRRR